LSFFAKNSNFNLRNKVYINLHGDLVMKSTFLLLVCLFLFLGCTQSNPELSGGSDKNTSLAAVEEGLVVKISSLDINTYNAARAEKVELCESISDSLTKSKCFLEFALDNNDSLLCESISVPKMQFLCIKKLNQN
jgi:hypothetical protein